MVPLGDDAPQEGGHDHKDEGKAQQAAPEAGNVAHEPRLGVGEEQADEEQAHDGVESHGQEHGAQQLVPGAAVAHGHGARGVAGQGGLQGGGQMAVEHVVGRQGKAHHVGREEGRNNRHGHDDGIEEVVGHLQGGAQRSDDEGELAYLRQREARLHGLFERLSREHYAEAAEHGLTHQHQDDEHEYGAYVLCYDGGVYHHADRYEEHR